MLDGSGGQEKPLGVVIETQLVDENDLVKDTGKVLPAELIASTEAKRE